MSFRTAVPWQPPRTTREARKEQSQNRRTLSVNPRPFLPAIEDVIAALDDHPAWKPKRLRTRQQRELLIARTLEPTGPPWPVLSSTRRAAGELMEPPA